MIKKTNMDYPKISIITCVFNGEKYISRLLESVLNMDYPNIEHIIVNDGSTDSTEKIVNIYSHLYKNKSGCNLSIKYIKQDNMGLGGATNTGLKAITGKYWTWINCDDWYEYNAFNNVIRLFNKKTDFVLLNYYIYYLDGMGNLYTKGEQRNNKIQKKLFSSINKTRKVLLNYPGDMYYTHYLVKTDSFRRINKNMTIDPFRYTQDWQLMGQLCLSLKWRYYEKPLVNFLKRDDSLWESGKVEKENFYSAFLNSINMLSIDGKYIRSYLKCLDFNNIWNKTINTKDLFNNKERYLSNCKKCFNIYKSTSRFARRYFSKKRVLLSWLGFHYKFNLVIFKILMVGK